MDELTEDQKGLIATAIRYGQFPPKPEHLPDCHWLMERGCSTAVSPAGMWSSG